MSETRTAAGFVLAHIENRKARYLLLCSTSHGNWLPPKGHADEGDADELATAIRELKEETGIRDVALVEDFRQVIEYDVDTPRGQYHKQVVYLLGTTPATKVVRSSEHIDHGWFDLDKAVETLGFEQIKNVLRAADERLRQVGLVD